MGTVLTIDLENIDSIKIGLSVLDNWVDHTTDQQQPIHQKQVMQQEQPIQQVQQPQIQQQVEQPTKQNIVVDDGKW